MNARAKAKLAEVYTAAVKHRFRPFRPNHDCDGHGMTNGTRANRAERAVIAYRGTDAPDDTYDTVIQDLLCDLMHLCDRDRIDFNAVLEMARRCQGDER